MKRTIVDGKGNNIPAAMKDKFKVLFGDNNGIERVEAFISIYFDLPMEKVKGNVIILNDKDIDNNNKKIGVMNIFLFLKIPYCNKIVNIKASNEVLDQSDIDHNMVLESYDYHVQLKKRLFFYEIEPMIEIWFDKGFKDINEGNSIIEKYFFRDSNGQKLNEKKQINHINIERCYKIWCNNNVQKFSEYDQKIIYFGAMLCTRNIDEFKKCLEELPIADNIKNDIEKTNEVLNEDKDIINWYNHEKNI